MTCIWGRVNFQKKRRFSFEKIALKRTIQFASGCIVLNLFSLPARQRSVYFTSVCSVLFFQFFSSSSSSAIPLRHSTAAICLTFANLQPLWGLQGLSTILSLLWGSLDPKTISAGLQDFGALQFFQDCPLQKLNAYVETESSAQRF